MRQTDVKWRTWHGFNIASAQNRDVNINKPNGVSKIFMFGCDGWTMAWPRWNVCSSRFGMCLFDLLRDDVDGDDGDDDEEAIKNIFYALHEM